MDITLEKIELVKDRTGATYKDAKEALEATDGSVIDAILAIEEATGVSAETKDFTDNPLFKKIKAIVDKGNASKIIVLTGGKEVISLPVTVGVLGVVCVPWAVLFSVIAGFGLDCEVQFVNDNGELFDINGKIIGMYDKAKQATFGASGKGSELLGNIKKKGTGIFNNVKEQVLDAADEIKTRHNAMKDQPLDDSDFEVEYEVIEEDNK